MLEFQSSVLSSGGRVARAGRASQPPRSRRSWLVLGVVLSFLLFLVLAILAVTLGWATPSNGNTSGGRWLLWLHDSVWLPMKGWLVTRWFPYSLLVWGLLFLGFLIWLLGLITGRPLWRGSHRRWTRSALRKPSMHGFLHRGSGLLGRLGFRPVLLRETLLDEVQAESAALLSDDQDGSSVARLLKLEDDLLNDHLSLPVDPVERFRIWQQALLAVRHSGDEAVWRDLEERGATRLAAVIRDGDVNAPAWSAPAVARDAQALLRLGPLAAGDAQLNRLLLLRSWVGQLERGILPRGVPDHFPSAIDDSGGGEARDAGRIAELGVSQFLDWAVATRDARAAELLRDGLRHLRFTARCQASRFPEGSLVHLNAFLAGAPTELHREVIRQLSARRQEAIEREARESGLVEDGLLRGFAETGSEVPV